MRGRPLGFLVMVAAGWVGARTVMLWPEGGPVETIVAQHAAPAALAAIGAAAPAPIRAVSLLPPGRVPPPRRSPRRMMTDAEMLALFGLHFFVEVRPETTAASTAVTDLTSAPTDPLVAAVASARPGPSRWSVSSWLLARPGGSGAGLAPLLGASQAGARMSYALDEDRRLALFVRAAKPFARGGGELAAGGQWRPTRAPITGFVEARYRAGAGVAPAVGVFGGMSAALPADFRLESYAQAGWVGGGTPTGFAEGQARAAHGVATIGGLKTDLGVGAWGAVQRGAGRLDVGPGIGIVLPLGQGATRLQLDWRQRVAGRAAPGSGPVLTLGAGF